MKLGALLPTIRALYEELVQAGIAHEIIVVNDNSTDETEAVLCRTAAEIRTLR